MKKVLFTLCLFSLIACGANPENYMDKVLDNIYIGMSEQDFKNVVKKKKVIEMKPDLTVYMVDKKTYHDFKGWRSDYRYFYFVNGKLTQVDKGQRDVDYRIKID